MSFKNMFKFGSKKEECIPTASDAIQRLRELEELLESKQQFLEQKIEAELKIAKTYGNTNKRLAMQALKRKRRYEKQLQQIDGTLSTIEMQRETLEGAHTNTTVLKTMKFAADAIRKSHETMDVDKVHDLMDDIAEQQDLANEIADAISKPVSFAGYDVDEEELEKELEELYQRELDEELLDAGASPVEQTLSDLPSVPEDKLPQKKTQSEEDLQKLQKWAS